ncbi:MAG: fumarylacetoacetase [Acidimicrobiales bacterium]
MTAGGGPWPPVPEGSAFGVETLPYGVYSRPGRPARVGVAIGDHVLDLAGALDGAGPVGGAGGVAAGELFARPSLNAFLALGPGAWREVRARVVELLTDPGARSRAEAHLVPASEVRLHLPVEVADYVDFYCSEEHATNLGRMFRPDEEPLKANWRHLPVGYHGRAGTVVVSGTPVQRPCGQRRPPNGGPPAFGPSTRLDIEAEVGFVVGAGSTLGQPVGVDELAEHVLGVVLLNDWSARDIQAWEYVPLGPFLSKSFATSISPWVVPLEALEAARVPGPLQVPEPLPYLRRGEPWGLDLSLEVALNGEVVSSPPFAGLYWTPAQMLAHLTVNGASLRPGDLYASGTVSGPARDQRGSLIELTWNGAEPLELADGSTRDWLADGDTVTISGWAPGPAGARVGLGAVAGTILPAR